MTTHRNIRADELASDLAWYGAPPNVSCHDCGLTPQDDSEDGRGDDPWECVDGVWRHVYEPNDRGECDAEMAQLEAWDGIEHACDPPQPMTETEAQRLWGAPPADVTPRDERRRRRLSKAAQFETTQRILDHMSGCATKALADQRLLFD